MAKKTEEDRARQIREQLSQPDHQKAIQAHGDFKPLDELTEELKALLKKLDQS